MTNLNTLLVDPATCEVLSKHVRTFVFNALDDDVRLSSSESGHFDVHVEWRNEGSWAVVHGARNINRRYGKGYEGLPSSRTQRFKNAYRFSLEEAIKIAEKYSHKVTLGNYNVAGFNEWHRNCVAEIEGTKNVKV